MVTQCPECKGTLSTSATQCPHCGAPVRGGQLQGGTPMAAPVAMAQPVQPGYPAPQPGYPQPGVPAQPGYGGGGTPPGYPQPAGYPPAPPQKESHFVRNCLVCSCLLVLILIVGITALGVSVAKAVQNSFVTTPAEIQPIAQQVSPGVQTPPGYDQKFGINFDFLGTKAKGVVLTSRSGDSMIVYGAMSQKTSKDDFKKQVRNAMQNKPDASKDLPAEAEEQQTEEEFTLGSGEKVKFLRGVGASQEHPNKKMVSYVGIVEPFPNEFDWLGIMATGPEETFDKDGFVNFLGTIKAKK